MADKSNDTIRLLSEEGKEYGNENTEDRQYENGNAIPSHYNMDVTSQMQEPTDEEARTSKLDNLKMWTKKEVWSGFGNETKATLTLASGLVRALNVFISFDDKVSFLCRLATFCFLTNQ